MLDVFSIVVWKGIQFVVVQIYRLKDKRGDDIVDMATSET